MVFAALLVFISFTCFARTYTAGLTGDQAARLFTALPAAVEVTFPSVIERVTDKVTCSSSPRIGRGNGFYCQVDKKGISCPKLTDLESETLYNALPDVLKKVVPGSVVKEAEIVSCRVYAIAGQGTTYHCDLYY